MLRSGSEGGGGQRQVVAAEITVALLLSTFYRLARDISCQQAGGCVEIVRLSGTRSVVCVWLAANFKFLCCSWRRSAPSLSMHAASRLMAFLCLLVTSCWEEPLACPSQVDVVVCVFFLVSSLVLFTLEPRSNQQHKPDQTWNQNQNQPLSSDSEPYDWLILHLPQSLLVQTDRVALLLFGLMWLVSPDWLLGQDHDPLLHLYQTRSLGAMMIGDSLVALANYKPSGSTANRKLTWSPEPERGGASVFSSRLMGCIALLLYVLTSCTGSHAHICLSLLGASLWTGNSILGYLIFKQGSEKIFLSSSPPISFETEERREGGGRRTAHS